MQAIPVERGKGGTRLAELDFRLQVLMLTNYEAITLPVLIAGQNNTRGIQWWFISALTLAAVAPVVIIGLFLERYITRGLTAGAVKG
jgi:multiple sugar transport system permease protein